MLTERTHVSRETNERNNNVFRLKIKIVSESEAVNIFYIITDSDNVSKITVNKNITLFVDIRIRCKNIKLFLTLKISIN